VLFEMLTGAPPPSAIAEPWSSELDAIVSKALAKSLERRYQSAASLAADLRRMTTTLDARSETAQAVAPFVRRPRRRAAAFGIAVVIVAALVALVWALYAR
jgi:hypothetical protein